MYINQCAVKRALFKSSLLDAGNALETVSDLEMTAYK